MPIYESGKNKWSWGAILLSSVLLFGAMVSSADAVALTYSSDTSIYLSTPGITLVIKAGSTADALTVNASNIAITLSAGETATITSPQALSSTISAGGGSLSQTCVAGDASNIETEVITQSTGSATYTLTPTGSSCVRHAPGSGGGGTVTVSPSVTLSIPNGGATYAAGAQIGVSWSSANGAFTSFRISYSSNNGNTWSVLETTSNSSYTWTAPTISTTQGLIKVEGLDQNGAILASDTSDAVFAVAGTTVAPPPVAPPATTPPANDSTATGTYSSSAALANTPDINTDKGLAAPPAGTSVYCASGSLIKGSLPAVYYCGTDGKRYVFVNEKVFFSWYSDFSTVQIISDETLALIAIGGNITYRPGARMLKIQSDPKVYAVSRGGILRWIMTEAIAVRLYGANWNTMIDDVSDAFFVNYTVGAPITE